MISAQHTKHSVPVVAGQSTAVTTKTNDIHAQNALTAVKTTATTKLTTQTTEPT